MLALFTSRGGVTTEEFGVSTPGTEQSYHLHALGGLWFGV